MRYTWDFFVDSDMGLSRKFTHIMQIKGSGGDGEKPFVTFTGNKDNAKLQSYIYFKSKLKAGNE